MNINDMKESRFVAQKDVREPKTLTISKLGQDNVAGEDKPEELRWVLYFKEASKGLVLNQTNSQLAAMVTGSEESDDWPGKKVELFVDPTISYGGKIVGGVRIRPAPTGGEAAPAEAKKEDFDDDIPFR